jgi:hypothetical protein|tara:strand:- start:4522 stop:5229 length:708 start_codon:yes stop_codon:yes gene_type:complete
MKDNLFIHHHLGLGDHFDCNGMVRHIQQKSGYNQVSIFSKDNYYDMVNYMYRDNTKIKVVKIDRNKEYEEVAKVIRDCDPEKNDFLVVGHHNYDHAAKGKNCWEIFYDQVSIPYATRESSFHVERDLDAEEKLLLRLNPKKLPFAFIHDDKDRGFILNKDHILNKNLHLIENDNTENIFNFIGILEKAEEVHCMESSFKTLVDLYCKQEKLFFHDFRGHPLGSQSNKNWKTIKYE